MGDWSLLISRMPLTLWVASSCFRPYLLFILNPCLYNGIHTCYNNTSSCVLNSGFSTAPFKVQWGVRQGDRLSSYLLASSLFWIFWLSVYVATKALKVFWWIEKNLTWTFCRWFNCSFVKQLFFMEVFLCYLQSFGECSGLKINPDKLCYLKIVLIHHNLFKRVKMKHTKILGIHFSQNYCIKQKLHFDELIKSFMKC